MRTQIINLRPDVEQAVVGCASDALHLRGREAWQAYEEAKAVISRRCGWDAGPGEFDPEQYDAAIARYLDLARM